MFNSEVGQTEIPKSIGTSWVDTRRKVPSTRIKEVWDLGKNLGKIDNNNTKNKITDKKNACFKMDAFMIPNLLRTVYKSCLKLNFKTKSSFLALK